MPEQPHILVVDDEQRIRTMLRRYLVEEGFRVSEAADGAAMRTVLSREHVDLVLLDLMMPGEDGLTLARYIRQNAETPIIMLTGKSDVIDRVAGLEAGADDYIAKPFHLREVLARIRTVLRRLRSGAANSAPAVDGKTTKDGETIVFQGWHLDTLKRELRQPNGNILALTTGEFDLLLAFARNPNRVLSRDRLMDLVKGRDWAAYDRAIDTQVARLRKKIEQDPSNPRLIKTVRGAGYIFAVVPASK
ncbi:MAG TPA: response regulator [Alphaproteobacteria bacterium]|nr:response regulator [Alphaproteobacteria bacterium]